MKELINLNGVGPKILKILNNNGFYSTNDLIEYYPFRYDEMSRSDIDSLEQDERIVIDGYSENFPFLIRLKGKLDKMTFRFNVGSRIVNVVIFNRGFLRNKIKPRTTLTLVGKYDLKHNTIIASDIKFSALSSLPPIIPIYHSFEGITSKQISSLISQIEDYNVIEYVPDYLKEKYGLLDKLESVKKIHNPSDMKEVKSATNYLKYEELFLFMLKMNRLKNNKNNQVGLKRDVEYSKVVEFIDNLPFKLTKDQLKSVDDIYSDLMSHNRMNRLLQGDVGSGKTIVSIIAIYINYLSGYQSALMAPTEILAHQHFNNIVNLFKNYNIRVSLLTGKMKVKEKKEVYKKLESKEIDLIIGTHALFQDDVKYNNLGLVITDEQHRFGVNQRGSLKNKGITPDILYMSATPIPRTYALTLYGDMDISTIRTRPEGRKEIITTLKHDSEIKDVLESMLEELKKGHQIYVIAPLIEESDKINLENINELESKMKSAFSKYYNIGVMHGKMESKEKEAVMNQFQNNEIQILISTTVIEVGVDVKNATMMVIFDSFRFGLSAIHQLRGRVGRNEIQSYCILISSKQTDRLNILTETSDGFKISEEDFRLRGSGDLFGLRQSGDMSFMIADIKNDYNILLYAKEDSKDFLKCKIDDIKYKHIKDLIDKNESLN